MKHLTEEEMIEQVYGEGESPTAQHLGDCLDCARSLAELRADLAVLRGPEAPPRSDSYGEQVWSPIQGSLPVYDRPARFRVASSFGGWFGSGRARGLAYAAVCALLVCGAFIAGRNW